MGNVVRTGVVRQGRGNHGEVGDPGPGRPAVGMVRAGTPSHRDGRAAARRESQEGHTNMKVERLETQSLTRRRLRRSQ